jgi:hypothetical protein
MTYGNALAALADPTRRHVFERLKSGPHAVAEIARGVPVSRPAESQHRQEPKEAGMVEDRPEERSASTTSTNGLGALRQWLDQFWDRAPAPSRPRWSGRAAVDGEVMSETIRDRAGAQDHSVNASAARASRCSLGLGKWWPRDHGIASCRERNIDGAASRRKWYEIAEDGSRADVGKIVAWEPPQRTVMTWDINSQWKPDTAIG